MPISMKKVKQPSLYFLVFVVLGTKLPFSVYVDYNLPLKIMRGKQANKHSRFKATRTTTTTWFQNLSS